MNPDQKKTYKHILHVILACSMAIGAGWVTVVGLEARRQEGQCMHAVLRMNAMQIMEQMEYNEITKEIEYAHIESNQIHTLAQGLDHMAQQEQKDAQQQTLRAQFFQRIADNNNQKVSTLTRQWNDTEQERLVLLHKLHEEEEMEKELIQQLRDAEFPSTLCETRGLVHLCELIGGITMLQKEVDETDLQIHRDMEQLAVIYRQEYLQDIAVEAFQQRAMKYQQVADDLVRTANLWMKQANQDQIHAELLLHQAKSVEEQTTLLEKRSQSYQDSIQEMTDSVQNMLKDAHRHERASQIAFCISLVLLIIPLTIFTYRSVSGVHNILGQVIKWSQHNQHNPIELIRGLSYFVLHILFFLMIVTANREYLANLNAYSTQKRAVIILYVAFLGSLLQSFWIQAVPHFFFEKPWESRHDRMQITWMIVQLFGMRLVLLIPCYVMEILLVWLSPFRLILLDPSPTWVYFVYFSLVLALQFYFISLEPREGPVVVLDMNYEDHSTVNQEVDDDDDDDFDDHEEEEEDQVASANENTPLKSTQNSTETELFPELYLSHRMDPGRRGIDTITHYSLNESSPYHVDVRNGLKQVLCLIETFVLFCSLVNLSLILTLSIPQYVKGLYIALGCMIVTVYLVLMYMSQCRSSNMVSFQRQNHSDNSSKFVLNV